MLDLAAVPYANIGATQQCLQEDAAGRRALLQRLGHEGPIGVIRSGPPGPVFASVAIINQADQILAVQRSGVVSQEAHKWQIGIANTMQ